MGIFNFLKLSREFSRTPLKRGGKGTELSWVESTCIGQCDQSLKLHSLRRRNRTVELQLSLLRVGEVNWVASNLLLSRKSRTLPYSRTHLRKHKKPVSFSMSSVLIRREPVFHWGGGAVPPIADADATRTGLNLTVSSRCCSAGTFRVYAYGLKLIIASNKTFHADKILKKNRWTVKHILKVHSMRIKVFE